MHWSKQLTWLWKIITIELKQFHITICCIQVAQFFLFSLLSSSSLVSLSSGAAAHIYRALICLSGRLPFRRELSYEVWGHRKPWTRVSNPQTHTHTHTHTESLSKAILIWFFFFYTKIIIIHWGKNNIWSPADFVPLPTDKKNDQSLILMVGLFEQWETE